MKRAWNSRILASFALVLFSLLHGHAGAADFSIQPLKVFMDSSTRTAAVAIRKGQDEEPLNLRIENFEWTQDADGSDVYTESSELVFYPKSIRLEKNEEGLIRIGRKSANFEKEKTYRLFITEVPKKTEGQAQGTNVAVAIRFAVPVFVKPVKEILRGEIADFSLEKGTLTASVRNHGNVHLAVESVKFTGTNAQGEEVFASEANGWYILNGATKKYSITVSPEACAEAKAFTLEVVASGMSLRGKMEKSNPPGCAR